MATIPAAAPTGNLQNLSAMMGNIGGTSASMNSVQVAVDPHNSSKIVAVWVDNDPVMDRGHCEHLLHRAGGGLFARRRQVLAAVVLRAGQHGEPPDRYAAGQRDDDRGDAPYAYVSTPSLGFDYQDNFYILDEYQDAPTAAGSASGAVVLQKYDFSTTTPAVVPFFNNEQDPSSLSGGAREQPEDHLPVVHLGQQRPGDRSHDDGGRQPGDPAAERRVADRSDLGQRLRLVDDHRHHRGERPGGPDLQPEPDLHDGLLGRGQQLRPAHAHRRQHQQRSARSQRPAARPTRVRATPSVRPARLELGDHGQPGAGAEPERADGRPGNPRRPGHGHLGQRRQQSADGQYPHARPRHLVRRVCGPGHPDRQLCHGRHADPDHGQPLQHHQPGQPRRPDRRHRTVRRSSTWACTWSRPAARSTSCSRTRRSSRIPPTRSWGCPAAMPSGSRSTRPRRSAVL